MPEHRALFATDLDGTLLARDGTVPARSLEALLRAEAEGVAIAVVTGRRRSSMRKELRKLDGLRYRLAVSSASVILGHDNERPETVRSLPWEPVDRLAARQDVASAAILCITLPPAPNPGEDEAPECFVLSPRDRQVFASHLPWDPSTHEPAREQDMRARPLIHLAVVTPARAEAERLAPAVRGVFESDVTVHAVASPVGEGCLVEVTPAGGKGHAIRHLAERLGVPERATGAVGDDMNDSDLLDAASHRFAVGGSLLAQRRSDALVVGSCADGAVADAVDAFLRALDHGSRR